MVERGFLLRRNELLILSLLFFSLFLTRRFFLDASSSHLSPPDGHNLALASDLGSLDALPVGLFDHIHMHHSHLYDLRCLSWRHYRLWLFWNDSTSVFSTKADVLVHALVLLVKQTLLIVTSIVCFEEEVELLLFDLLGEALGLLLVSRLQE